VGLRADLNAVVKTEKSPLTSAARETSPLLSHYIDGATTNSMEQNPFVMSVKMYIRRKREF
jgi:hypothetical protein